MSKTVFYDHHVALGARMVSFAGFDMPVEYGGVRQEHINVRENAGLFDVSHMGEIWIKGPKAFELVQRLTSNDVTKLIPGKIQYTCFPNEDGGIVDDLLIYRYEDERYLLVVNASNIEKDYNWIIKQNIHGASIDNASDRISQLAVQGPKAVELLQKLTPIDLSTIPYYNFVTAPFADADEAIISNSGYTGAGGFELYLHNKDGAQVWEQLMKAGKEFDLEPAGLAARDTLRLEMGFCLYGNDITDTTSPLEAGLGWITKFVEGNDFINRAALEQQKAEGVKKQLVGFVLQERGIPRQHYTILNGSGETIGEVTSGTISPMTKKGIGMGIVELPFASNGQEILIGIRNKQIPAQIVKPPFYKNQA